MIRLTCRTLCLLALIAARASAEDRPPATGPERPPNVVILCDDLKWHLGHLSRYLPTRHGFDRYFGIPYSNDMDRDPALPEGRGPVMDPRVEFLRVPLLREEEEVERAADQRTLTRRYTDEAVRFVGEDRDRPFFLYLAHTMRRLGPKHWRMATR